eukprot:CAMPEP_0118928874 /NCGR_PEP_ID=MMETSP1169-20130426/6023_1 /TAXON_ID=36882 /ORGANISM="Pyramimonas obovata, Strain CCMP722" /LENGTH=253 /DNA_ID=CAMNT_0006870949 /DNA_START=78 /DNA_END=836 /DNA_ORIENTATION=-
MGVRRKCAVRRMEYESEEMCKRFEPLAEKVASVFPETQPDRRELSELTGQLLQFMEDHLGRESINPPFPKLPSLLFRNLSPTGPLFLILTLTLEYKKMKGWQRLDFLTSSDKEEVFELFQYLREELSRKKLLKFPKCYLQPDIDYVDVADLKEKAEKLGFTIAKTPEEKGVTHVILRDIDAVKEENTFNSEYCRTLEIQGNKALVHWWYWPDSYDEWIPVDNISGDPEADEEPPSGAWTVYSRWIRDSARFNE